MLRAMLRGLGTSLYSRSDSLNMMNMRHQLGLAGNPREILDLGCGDGRATAEITARLVSARISGLEGHEPTRTEACARGIDAVNGDLEQRLPFADDSFDAVISNQVIEHLSDTDNFVSEIRRVLRPGGLAIVATENLASWHNVGALILGFQPFSSANYSTRRYPLGNPLALHSQLGEELRDGMMHRRIFTVRALRELFEAHGFDVVDVRGSGYHPFPPAFGRIDVAHAHFISVSARKTVSRRGMPS